MTRRIGSVLIIEEEKPQMCEECGKIRELRPYGENNKCICFDCAMKNEKLTKKKFMELYFPEGL